MSAIGGDGGIRRTLESGRGLPAEALARATELARGPAAMLDERNAQGPQETARLLFELRHLPAEAQQGFLGAEPARVARSVFGEMLLQITAGIAVGLPAALAASSAANTLLFESRPPTPALTC